MGHSDVDTTMTYMHHRSRAGDARLLGGLSPRHAERVCHGVRRMTTTGTSGSPLGDRGWSSRQMLAIARDRYGV